MLNLILSSIGYRQQFDRVHVLALRDDAQLAAGHDWLGIVDCRLGFPTNFFTT